MRRIKHIILSSACALCLVPCAFAQDLHFSQFFAGIDIPVTWYIQFQRGKYNQGNSEAGQYNKNRTQKHVNT